MERFKARKNYFWLVFMIYYYKHLIITYLIILKFNIFTIKFIFDVKKVLFL